MSYMANRIVREMKIEHKIHRTSKEMTKKYFCKKARNISVFGVDIVVQFNDNTFDDLHRRIIKANGATNVIP